MSAFKKLCKALKIKTVAPSAPPGQEDTEGRIEWRGHEAPDKKERRGCVAVGLVGGLIVYHKRKTWKLCTDSRKAVWSNSSGTKVDEKFQKISRPQYEPRR